MNDNDRSVRLIGGAQQTATWVKVLETGDLLVDHYDHSDDAQNYFGNDVAFVLTISASEKQKILRLLASHTDETNAGYSYVGHAPDDLLLKLMQERFDSYAQVEAWLKENEVEYQKAFDSWA